MPTFTDLPHLRKPNQQLIAQIRQLPTWDAHDARLARAHALGASVRERLLGCPLPLLAVRTTYSLLRGTASPERWRHALAGLWGIDPIDEKDRRGENRPAADAGMGLLRESMRALERTRVGEAIAPIAPPPPVTAPLPERLRPVLADRDDLLGLPACIDQWGRDRIGVGATIELGDGVSTPAAGEVLLLAPTAEAYASLCRLLSWHNESAESWRRWNAGGDAEERCDGLIALVRDEWWGRRLAGLGAEVWWRAGLRPQQMPVPFPIACAPIITHLGEEDARAAPTLAAIRERRTVGPGDRGARGIALDDLPLIHDSYLGYEDQIERGGDLAARCRYLPGGCDERGEPILQLPPAGAGLGGDPDADPDQLLREKAEAGLRWRYGEPVPAEARARLEKELDVIASKRFATYILTVREMTRDRRTCGRGSAASSIVCYALGMTNVDPVRWNLLFERFLAPERTDPPDIDIDFAWDERDGVQAEVIARYGRDHVAMVATHQAMHRWAALREAARAHGFGDGEITAMRARLRLADSFGGLVEQPEPWPTIVAAAEAIAGAPRHLGLHCGGVLITDRPIRELVPVHHAAKELEAPIPFPVPTVAWEKDGCEDLGLVKIDVLGNRSLAVIRDCLRDLKEEGFDFTSHPLPTTGDARTREIVAKGATMGCFYIESPATRQLQAKVGSPEFDRLVVHSSIIRPAGTGFIDDYIKRYHLWKAQGGRITPEQEAEWYPHPALKKLLSESFGILSYQEDVMQVAQDLAGFTTAESNKLRKALGRSDTLMRLRGLVGRFYQGCRDRNVAEEVISRVWEMISSFAGYSFCKAHSASYAVVSFECAWFKAHYPAVFMARVIANQGGFYRTVAYVEEARRLGVDIHGPCALRSGWMTRCEGLGAIRLGLQLVKGLSEATAQRIIDARSHGFSGLRDFKRRCAIPADELRALCDAGALDALTPTLNHAQRAWLATVVARDREAFIAPGTPGAQAVLDLAVEDDVDPTPPLLRDLTLDEIRRRRWACLGVLPDAHPLCLWRLPPRRVFCRDIKPEWKGRRISLIAWPIADKEVSATYSKDRHGNELPELRYESMCFATCEDETGLVETVWFPDAFRAYGALLFREEPLRLHGKVDQQYGVATLTVERAETVGAPISARAP